MLIVGLGNPGEKFQKTRHNFGFIVIDKIAEKYQVNFTEKFNSLYGNFKINNHKIILLKPQTFMNLSGKSVSSAIKFFSENCEQTLVIHDDLETKFGKIKHKLGGSDRGHNGLKSITGHTGPNYHRLCLGIGRPDHNDISDYVLDKFTEEEYEIAEKIAEEISKNLEEAILDQDLLKLLKI